VFNELHIMRNMAALLGVLILCGAWVLHRRSLNHNSKIVLDDLLLGDDGKMSKSAAVMFGSFVLTSWVIVFLTMTDKLDSVYFAAYIAAWVIPAVTRLIKGNAAPDNATVEMK